MTGITESDVMMHWFVTPPLYLEPITMGANNRSYLVRSGAGAYVLKWYRNVADPQRLRIEHELLNVLGSANLPFAVPALVPTLSGDSHVDVREGFGTYILVLFHLIPGQPASFGDGADAYRSGQALAILDGALQSVPLDPAVALPEAFGDLSSIHAYVPRPPETIKGILGARPVAHVMLETEDRWNLCTSAWHSQLIHGDFYPSNTMVSSDKVSGILDFEFSGLGYRTMDFAIGLAAFSTKDWELGCSWPLLESFAKGYLHRVPFRDEELATVPTMMLKREASSLVHWLGRMEQGLTSLDDIQSRAARLLALDRWMEGNENELLDRLDRINR